MVANRHAVSTAAADHHSLEQRGTLARWPAAPIGSDCLRALVQSLLVLFVLFPREIACVNIEDQSIPLVTSGTLRKRVLPSTVFRLCVRP